MTFVIQNGVLEDCRFENLAEKENTTTLAIPEGVTKITKKAFRSCFRITELSLPASLQEVEFAALWKFRMLESIHTPDGFPVLAAEELSQTKWYAGQTGAFMVLGKTLLRYQGNDKNVTVPEGIVCIGKEAFRQNLSVRTVTLPESVRIIGASAFSGCTALEEIALPDGLQRIDDHAFSYCIGLREITLPDTLTVLEENVFECCSSLKSIRFPAGITEIPPGICEECTGLEEVILPETTRTIRSSAFYNCTGLTEIRLPEHLERIYDSAFYCCEHIEAFLLPDSLTEIDGYAFTGCRRLKSITLPGSLKILGRHCFRRCSDLQNIHVAPENRYFCSMDGVVCSKDGTLLYMVPPGKTELLLPETLTKIVPHILLGCEKLTVLRLHPDDTGICRQYHRVRDVESEIVRALEMIRTKKYTTQVHSAVKYPFIIQQYLREPDAVTAAYLRRCMTRIMTDAVRAGDLTGISALAGTEGLFTQTGIEKYLQLALKEKQPRIWAVLADYKHRHFGFAEKNDLL